MQRALLCRAVISDPKLLILDEPANFVDNKFENELYRTLRELNSRMAIVMVSHDIGTITSVVKEIVCVNRRVHRHHSNVITEEQLAQLRLPYSDRIPRAYPAHRAGAPSGRLLLRPRLIRGGTAHTPACGWGAMPARPAPPAAAPNVPAADRYTVFAIPGQGYEFRQESPEEVKPGQNPYDALAADQPVEHPDDGGARRKPGSPAPRFSTETAAPLSFLTSEGIRADSGTYPASGRPELRRQPSPPKNCPPKTAANSRTAAW